jgi:tRNA-dihydrouridine synthase 3
VTDGLANTADGPPAPAPLDWRGMVMLAPLTKGGNLPFRRLCVEGGARVTVSEMAYARQVVRGSRSELALLRRHASEECFGVQLAISRAEEAIAAGKRAVAAGARFVDINCGCPIHDVVRRGMGATLLQRPSALARLVEALVAGLDVPVTVKIRTGWSEDKINAHEIARLVEEAGAAALIVHGRTREQRYTKAADWDVIGELVAERSIPVIGNGDILTWYEARDRLERSNAAGLMLGRGALIKPWLFREIAEQRDILPTVDERVELLARFVGHLKDHFRDDEKGRERTMRFLPWHLGFFARYRPLPQARYEDVSREHPLMQTRLAGEHAPEPASSPVDALLRDPREEIHARIAETAWSAADAADLGARLVELAIELPPVEGEAGEVATAHG